jgi:hypothetical protein
MVIWRDRLRACGKTVVGRANPRGEKIDAMLKRLFGCDPRLTCTVSLAIMRVKLRIG